tara:strand:+ start:4713 stop:5723 length:1011 start_codon:yes stop_codon:yes gene_type:complete
MADRNGDHRMVTSVTPQRLSFVGGGTDLPDYFSQLGGAVVSTTIDKYIYVTLKRHSPLFGEAYRLSYSVTEHVDSLDDIQNDIARECLRLVPVEPPLYMSTIADLPAFSGLGSSSSFAVGLLNALHALKGETVSAGQLAEEACHVEIDVLKRPIGKQDQYAAAFGGLNLMTFHSEGSVSLEHLWLQNEGVRKLFESSLTFWTGIQRDADSILHDQKQNIQAKLSQLKLMTEQVSECRSLLLSGFDVTEFGRMLDQNWRLKRSLSSKISNSQIDAWYECAKEAGAIGGKLAGAGGGGFLFLIAPTELHQKIIDALPEMSLVTLNYEPRGSRILQLGR